MGFWYKATIVFAVCGLYLQYTRETYDPNLIAGKRVLITGASSGIGEQLAYQYAKRGASVYLTARRDELLQEVQDNCEVMGSNSAKFGHIAADMSKYDKVAERVVQEAVKALGGLDHVILNHAFLPQYNALWLDTPRNVELLAKTMHVNFMSYTTMATAAIPYLSKNPDGGAIGIVSSLAGKIDSLGAAPYCASKFALDGFFSTLRNELVVSEKNVTVTLCPIGLIATDGGRESFENMLNLLNIDEQKFLGFVGVAQANETAEVIMWAVAKGQREFYHPSIFGIPHGGWLLPVIRHIAPSLLDGTLSNVRKDT